MFLRHSRIYAIAQVTFYDTHRLAFHYKQRKTSKACCYSLALDWPESWTLQVVLRGPWMSLDQQQVVQKTALFLCRTLGCQPRSQGTYRSQSLPATLECLMSTGTASHTPRKHKYMQTQGGWKFWPYSCSSIIKTVGYSRLTWIKARNTYHVSMIHSSNLWPD